MLVVPLRGDKIENKDGIVFTVMSYTNYRDKGPAVYVEHTPGIPSDAVYFFDIIKINEKTVEYVPGSKVFKAMGSIRRKLHLPQPNDTITFKSETGSVDCKVTGLRLHKRSDLAKGLLVVCEQPDSEEKSYVRLDQLISLERDIGNDMFSKDKFLSYYDDYRGSR